MIPPVPTRVLLLGLALAVPSAGAASVVDPSAVDLSDARHVRAVYLDLLGRTPDADERDLVRSARPETLVPFLASSREAWEQWYEEELQFLLLVDNQRPEDGDPEDALPARLARGELDVLAAVRGLFSSAAFHRANPGNDTFVSVVLEQALGLVVQDERHLLDAGKRMYDGQRATLFGREGRSQADVVAIACAQPAFAERFVARQYERIVGRTPARVDVDAAAAALRADPSAFPALVTGWVLSDAYAERLGGLRRKSDRQFVRALGVDLLGRPPDAADVRRFRRALASVADSGPLRAVIAGALLERHGAGLPLKDELPLRELADTVWERFLGRLPSADEVQALALAYQDAHATPELLVRAVVTHVEYQYY